MVVEGHAEALVVFPVEVFGSFALLYHGEAVGLVRSYIISLLILEFQ